MKTQTAPENPLTKTSIKYQSYRAHWQQRKAKERSRLKQRHQDGLETAKALADILKSDFGARKVVLFGSMLSVNNIRMRSDLDLMAWGLASDDYIKALTALMRQSDSFAVDLVRIEEAPPSLKKYVLEKGLVLGKEIPQSNELTEKGLLQPKYAAMISRIRQTMLDMEREYQRAHEQANLAKETKQKVYWVAVGFCLHGFYTSLEKAFERIADNVDRGLIRSKSDQWHKDLLDQMTLDIPGVRPPVIDSESHRYLYKYLSFQHVIRSNYTHRLDPEHIAENYEMLEDCHRLITEQLNDFCEFLASVD